MPIIVSCGLFISPKTFFEKNTALFKSYNIINNIVISFLYNKLSNNVSFNASFNALYIFLSRFFYFKII